MNVEIVLAIASFALSKVGLVPIFLLKEHKKIMVLTVIISALLVTTGGVLVRALRHEELIGRMQAKIRV